MTNHSKFSMYSLGARTSIFAGEVAFALATSSRISVSYGHREYDPPKGWQLLEIGERCQRRASLREDEMKISLDQILPKIFVGACPRTAAHIDQLKHDFGITAILNLQTEEDFAYWGNDWDDLAAHYRDSGMVAIRTPVQDFDADALRSHLPHCVKSLDDLVREGHIVYVHCTAGINRSPSTVIAYLLLIEQWDWDRAVDQVTSRRNCDPYLDVIRLATEDREN